MHMNGYQSVVAHMEWADALAWMSVLSLPATQHEQPLLARLYHIHVVQWAYLQVWRGETVNVPEAGHFAGLPAVAAWAAPHYVEVRVFVERTPAHVLSRELPIPWAGEIVKRFGLVAPATLGETIVQVVMHSTYHRAQIATRIRELGGEPPLTDYIAWIWQNRPAAEWP